MTIAFGTDGIRHRYGEYPLNTEGLTRIATGFATWLRDHKTTTVAPIRILMGEDTRASSSDIRETLTNTWCAMGVEVYHTGVAPTPALAYLTQKQGMDLGVMITASHNLYHDNGLKFFPKSGQKYSVEEEVAIQAAINSAQNATQSYQDTRPNLPRIAPSAYEAVLCTNAPNLEGLHIVLDTAHGAYYQLAPTVLQRLGACVEVMANAPNGTNINAECGATHIEPLQARVRTLSADMGIALDGDGDRVILVDDTGRMVDGDSILYLLASDFQQGVVGTQMSNLALEEALKKRHIPFYRSAVGDKHVLEMLLAKRLGLGAEPSGHVLFPKQLTTGDGLFAALRVLNALDGARLSVALEGYAPYPQYTLNVPVDKACFDRPSVISAIEKAHADAARANSRLLIRPSGTEPVVRILLEGANNSYNQKAAHALADALLAETKNML